MEKLMAEALEKLVEQDNRRGIRRFHVESEVRYVKEKDCFAFLKSGKATIPKLREKAIRKKLQLYGETELLRILLEEEVRRVLKRERIRDNCRVEALSYPLPALAKPGTYEEVWHLDIKACFYSIYARFGLDVRCKTQLNGNELKVRSVGRGLMTANRSELVAVLRDYKLYRNAIVGLMSSCFTLVYKNGRFERQFYKSKVLNLELRALICAILNSFICDKLNRVIYWNVDGGFMDEQTALVLKEEIEKLGFLEVKLKKVEKLKVTCLGGWQAIYTDGEVKTTGHYGHKGCNVCNVVVVKDKEEFHRWLRRL